MTGDEQDDASTAREAVADARRDAAMAQARLAEATVRYADARIAGDTAAGVGSGRRSRVRPGEFVADELALMLRDQPYRVRCLLARSRRMAAGLPTVWDGFRRGELDAEQMRVIDRVARRVTEPATLAALDEHVVDAAQARSPKQLQVWLLRLVVQLEPVAFAQRHRRALAERRVTVVQGADGIGYVTGEVSAADAAAIDAMLAATARNLGADDPRTDQQRRADLFADLLLGRIALDQPEEEEEEDGDGEDVSAEGGANVSAWLEVEDIDPDTGELLGTHQQPVDADGEPIGAPVDVSSTVKPSLAPKVIKNVIKKPRTTRIGVVVPLASLLDAGDAPGELADRSGFIPGDILQDQITDALGSNGEDQVLFTRLLTDNGGRLLDATELGRYPSKRLAEAIKIRAGSCRFPTCTVPADRCDLDHHQPAPQGETSGRNLDPFCRRHHRGKTFAWHAAHRDHSGVDWTMPDAEHYRCIDEP
ncbi:MAG TPA: DUF222 domain-containing protein, partial [Mycobacterium sp.]|nr:DUF222 domain-containing protein [Mycobacterium sp.]